MPEAYSARAVRQGFVPCGSGSWIGPGDAKTRASCPMATVVSPPKGDASF